LSVFALFENKTKLAFFDFTRILPPKLSSYGTWNKTGIYNSAVLSSRYFQLSLFDFENEIEVHYICEKTEEIEDGFKEQALYKFGFIGFTTFLCMWLVRTLLIKREKDIEKEEKKVT
jgi:hypothetical protein